MNGLIATIIAIPLCSLWVGGCGSDSTEPPAPIKPAIKLTAPLFGAVVPDTTLTVSGTAEAPGRILRVFVDSSVDLYKSADPDRQPVEASSSVSFSTAVRIRPGLDSLKVSMIWTRGGATVEQTDTMVVVRAYKPLAISLEIPDTIFGASLEVTARLTAGISTTRTLDSAVIDAGTAAKQVIKRVAGFQGAELFLRDSPCCFGVGTAWFVSSPYLLDDGSHRVALYFSADTGFAGVFEKNFVTRVPDVVYSVTALPDLGGAEPRADALDINARGTVAGWVRTANAPQAPAMWKANVLTLLDAAGTAVALNDSDVVVGSTPNGAVQWRDGQSTVISTTRAARDINNAGIVLLTLTGIWPTGSLTGISLLDAFKINDANQIIGTNRAPHGEPIAAGYRIAISPPGALKSKSGGFPFSGADVLNNRGEVAGLANGDLGEVYLARDGTPGISLALSFGPFGCYSPLGGAQVCNQPRPVGLNDNGLLLVFESGSRTTFLMDTHTGRTSRVKLDAGWSSFTPRAINANGQIVGSAAGPDGGKAVILTPR